MNLTPLRKATLIVAASGKYERPGCLIIKYMEQIRPNGRWFPTEAGMDIIRNLAQEAN
jgi:hypothetical protein